MKNMSDKTKRPTRKDAILTQCWHCMGYYQDGRVDCENVRCPLYEYMPYRKLEPTNELFAYSPRRVGMVTHEECKREMSDEQKLAGAERLAKARMER